MAHDTTTKQIARCGIYESRPQVCRDYPKVDQFMPEECTYTFVGSERRGDCACNIGACCNLPRTGGEPDGAPLSALAGGKACKNLIWVDAPEEKTASGLVQLPSRPCGLSDLVGGPK